MAKSMFDTAKTLGETKTTKKSTKQDIGVEGLKEYASICAIEKVLKTFKEVSRVAIDESMTKHFVDVAIDTKKRPDNFKGVDGNASASCELRQRSSASGLNDMEQETLRRHGIKTKVVEDKVETFVINPAYVADQKLLMKISTILAKDKSIPDDLFLKQESNKKVVVDEDGFAEVFSKSREALNELLPVVATLAVKPKLDGVDAVREAFDVVKELVGDDS
jgi:hypothetical protein